MVPQQSQEFWYPYDDGRTLGTEGSEHGTIVRDDVYSAGGRITLDRETRWAPFAITCGMPGFVHTTLAGTLEEATDKFEQMKAEIARLVDLMPNSDDPQAREKMKQVYAEFEQFVRRF